jgi:uncharacterized protein YqeY
MTCTPASRSMDDPSMLRSLLRADLVAAMKARQREAITALRTAIAAIDNAEAVTAPDRPGPAMNEHVAGAGVGVGSTEAARRVLSVADLRAILREQIAARRDEADRYDRYGEAGAADRLRREADVLKQYLNR